MKIYTCVCVMDFLFVCLSLSSKAPVRGEISRHATNDISGLVQYVVVRSSLWFGLAKVRSDTSYLCAEWLCSDILVVPIISHRC